MSARTSFRSPAPASLIPKILVAIILIAIFYQLSPWSSTPQRSEPIPTTLGDDVTKAPEPLSENIRIGHLEEDEEASPENVRPASTVAATSVFARPSPTASTSKKPLIDTGRIFKSYGTQHCMPKFDKKLQETALARNESCSKHAPFPSSENRRVAFASITTGKPEDAYQRAIESQMFHSAVHGSVTHVLCEQLADGAWNKIAFLLNLLMNEMLKPEDERLEWIMWIDRDAIVLDACRPLSAFVPPATPEFEKVNLITNHDGFGFNAGVFMFRVSTWSLELFSTILSFRYYRPDEDLILAEQTAMEKITREDKWKDSVVRVPWYWFNAYPDEKDSMENYRDNKQPPDLEWFRARRGDFVVHFAGDEGRSGRMPKWLDMLAEVGNIWEGGKVARDISDEIEKYWISWANNSLSDTQLEGKKAPTKPFDLFGGGHH